MATLVTGRPRPDLDVGSRTRRRALLCAREAARMQSDDRRLTLDELLVGAWEGLRSGHTVACPVCAGAMAPQAPARRAAGRRPVGGRCGSCGSELE